MNTTQLMLRCSLLAKDIAPKDSGNLAFNSIRAYKTPRGFRLVSLGNTALYGEIIDRGRTDRPLSQREKANVGWWSEGVYGAIETYLNTNLNTQIDSEVYQRVAKQSKNTEKRQKVFDRNIPSG